MPDQSLVEWNLVNNCNTNIDQDASKKHCAVFLKAALHCLHGRQHRLLSTAFMVGSTFIDVVSNRYQTNKTSCEALCEAIRQQTSEA